MSDVSVVIPTYNRGHRLERAVDSVIHQQMGPREIIVVDDGSADDTRKIIRKLSQRTTIPIKYYYQVNQGPSAARNRGIEMVSGEFIAFLDSDDEWHKDKLLIQYQALQSTPSAMISHTGERWLKNGRHLNQKTIHLPQQGDVFRQSLKLCCVGLSTVMVRKSLFDRYGMFDESLRCCEDYDLWLRIAPFESFLLIDKRLTVKHGGREDQVSSRYRMGMDRFRIHALSKVLKNVPLDPEKWLDACSELVRRCTIYSQGCTKYGKAAEGNFYRELAKHFSLKSFNITKDNGKKLE